MSSSPSRVLLLFSFSILVFGSFSQSIEDSCSNDQLYFDSTAISCLSCPNINQEANSDGVSCSCEGNFLPNDKTYFEFKLGCETADCPSNTAVSADKTECLSCTDCDCADADSVLTNISPGNIDLGQMSCVECKGNTVPGLNDNSYPACVRCDPGKEANVDSGECKCGDSYFEAYSGSCLLNSDSYGLLSSTAYTEDNAITITFYDLVDSGEVPYTTVYDSNVYIKYYKESAINCLTYKSIEWCQTLANLCVLALYDSAHPACALFQQAMSQTSDSNDEE